MAVEEHPVHNSTKRIIPRAGCHSRAPLQDGYWARDGYTWEGVDDFNPVAAMRYVWVVNTHSKLCRQIYDLPECAGCKAPKDHEYIERMKGLK